MIQLTEAEHKQLVAFAQAHKEQLRKAYGSHDLYKKGDPCIPECIQDRNGDIALDLCKRCNRGESELEEHCAIPREGQTFQESLASETVPVKWEDLKQWRDEWLAENDPQDGTDRVTPFDQYLYK